MARVSRARGSVNDSHSPEIHITNTYRPVLEWLMDSIESGAIYAGSKGKKRNLNPRWKPVFWWRCGGEVAIELLRMTLPYLRIKRRQAELVLALRELKRDGTRLSPELVVRRATLVSEIRLLNKRGLAE